MLQRCCAGAAVQLVAVGLKSGDVALYKLYGSSAKVRGGALPSSAPGPPAYEFSRLRVCGMMQSTRLAQPGAERTHL